MGSLDQKGPVFKVLDALDHPHGGRILRLRLQGGDPPRVRDLRGARLLARSPDGETERGIEVEGFADFGGKASDDRLRRTGRIDLRVFEEDGASDEAPSIDLRWTVEGPLEG